MVRGVKDYGNRMGVPTSNGSFHFHSDFRAKPTVLVGAYGMMPIANAKKGIPSAGDKVIAVGGRTGRLRRFNQMVKGKIPSRDLHIYVKKVLDYYAARKKGGESLGDFFARTPKEEISVFLEKGNGAEG